MPDQEEIEPAHTPSAPHMIPQSRLKEESKAKRSAQRQYADALTKISEYEVEIEGLRKRASTVDTLTESHAAAAAEWALKEQAWNEERGIYKSGITDPDAIDVARLLHGKLDADTRPSLTEWLGGFSEDPTQAPKALRPYLAAPEPVAEAEPEKPAETTWQATQAAQPTKPATGRAPAPGQPASGGQWTAARIADLNAEAKRTGDFSKLKEAMPSIRSYLANR